MLVRLKPGGALHIASLHKTIRPGDEVDLPRDVVERHAGRFEVLKADPRVAARVIHNTTNVGDFHVGGGWYDLPGHAAKVRKAEAEDLLAEANEAEADADGS